jgi:hypothetical protein
MKNTFSWFAAILFSLIIAVSAGTLANKYLNASSLAPITQACTKTGESHWVIIQDDTMQPTHTVGKLCDTMTIMNRDSRLRLMSFGKHDKHQSYDGVTEQVLAGDQSFTVVLNQIGTFILHDHSQDVVTGTFTVSR